jgi:hypothetical protein
VATPYVILLAVLVSCLLASCASVDDAGAGSAARPHPPHPTVAVPEALSTFRSSRELPAVPPPVHVDIAAIGVHSGIERLGQQPDRTVEVPRRWQWAGWYAGGPAPGEPGAAVILGHVDSPTGPAVFANLHRLRPGDRIVVRRADGSMVTFAVERIEQRSRHDFPVADVYWPTLRPELRLITCGGRYLRPAGYQDNVIVFAAAVRG